MKKSKGEQIELLYTNSSKINTSKKVAKKNAPIAKNNEIVVDIQTKRQNKKNTKVKEKSTTKKVNKKAGGPKVHQKAKISKIHPNKPKNKIAKWTILIVLILIAIILFLLSDVFNIKTIVVKNNSKVTEQEIIALSKLTTEDNIFSATNKKIRDNIKVNSYIEDVNIKRNLNGTITIEVEERVTTYMLKFANAYVYINNQGYILEVSDVLLNVPTITGFVTSTDNMKEGNRLAVEDLKKLDTVIKIMKSVRNNQIEKYITNIDITDEYKYILLLETEGKTVDFGDSSNINEKVFWIKKLIEKEAGISGEIIVEDIEKAIFREKV